MVVYIYAFSLQSIKAIWFNSTFPLTFWSPLVKANIYILNLAALNETIIPSYLHFSMQNIELSHDLGHASRWSNVNIKQ